MFGVAKGGQFVLSSLTRSRRWPSQIIKQPSFLSLYFLYFIGCIWVLSYQKNSWSRVVYNLSRLLLLVKLLGVLPLNEIGFSGIDLLGRDWRVWINPVAIGVVVSTCRTWWLSLLALCLLLLRRLLLTVSICPLDYYFFTWFNHGFFCLFLFHDVLLCSVII